jgi:hypothetical protein
MSDNGKYEIVPRNDQWNETGQLYYMDVSKWITHSTDYLISDFAFIYVPTVCNNTGVKNEDRLKCKYHIHFHEEKRSE